MKTLLNFGNRKLTIKVNGKEEQFLPNTFRQLDDAQANFLLKFGGIREIVNSNKVVAKPKQVAKKEVIEEELQNELDFNEEEKEEIPSNIKKKNKKEREKELDNLLKKSK